MSANRILCGHIKKNNKGKDIPCHRYLGDSTDLRVFIHCPRCGGYTTIESSNESEVDIKKALEQALIKLSKDKKEK